MGEGDTEADFDQQIRPDGTYHLFLDPAHRARGRGSGRGRSRSRRNSPSFPLIYWPIVPGAKKPSPQALARVDAYMKQGGTVVFEPGMPCWRPPGPGGEARSPACWELRAILSSLDIPELEPVPRDHVLTKNVLPAARFSGPLHPLAALGRGRSRAPRTKRRTTPSAGAAVATGVSSIIITSNDLAGAWATRPTARRCWPLVPGEPAPARIRIPRRRQHLMYTLPATTSRSVMFRRC